MPLKAQRKLSLAVGSWSFVTEQPKRCEHCRRKFAEVYAMDPIPNGWGGYYCTDCCERLRFTIVDRLALARNKETNARFLPDHKSRKKCQRERRKHLAPRLR